MDFLQIQLFLEPLFEFRCYKDASKYLCVKRLLNQKIGFFSTLIFIIFMTFNILNQIIVLKN